MLPSHTEPRRPCGLSWCEQHGRRVSLHVPFCDSHIEDLIKIPPEVVDRAEGQALLHLLVKQGLEFITLDAAELAPGIFQKQVVLYSVFIDLGG